MACFLVPAAEAVVTTVMQKRLAAKEDRAALENGAEKSGISFSAKLKWLNNLLWGGSALLAFEHLWHGEITLAFPFLTNVSNPADFSMMLHEMATVGTSMAAVVTAVWAVFAAAVTAMEKKAAEDPQEGAAET